MGAPPLEGQVLQTRFESSSPWLQQPSSYEYGAEIRALLLSSGPSHFLEQNEEGSELQVMSQCRTHWMRSEVLRLDNQNVSS